MAFGSAVGYDSAHDCWVRLEFRGVAPTGKIWEGHVVPRVISSLSLEWTAAARVRSIAQAAVSSPNECAPFYLTQMRRSWMPLLYTTPSGSSPVTSKYSLPLVLPPCTIVAELSPSARGTLKIAR
jgi:hypothetical protein